MYGSSFLCGRCMLPLPFLHLFPVVEAVQVIKQKHDKAGNHRQTGDIGEGCQNPQNNQYDVVGRVTDGVVGTA